RKRRRVYAGGHCTGASGTAAGIGVRPDGDRAEQRSARYRRQQRQVGCAGARDQSSGPMIGLPSGARVWLAIGRTDIMGWTPLANRGQAGLLFELNGGLQWTWRETEMTRSPSGMK